MVIRQELFVNRYDIRVSKYKCKLMLRAKCLYDFVIVRYYFENMIGMSYV